MEKRKVGYTSIVAAFRTSGVHWRSNVIYFSQGTCLSSGKMGIFCQLPNNKYAFIYNYNFLSGKLN